MLINKIKSYTDSPVYPFHMPGHKRACLNPGLPYSLDLTEIEGFDNLHNPKTCIKEVEDKAAKIYNAKRAFMLVNGSTGGIMAAIGSLTKRGDTVIAARNCHISVCRAVRLFGLKPKYITPENAYDDIFGSISPNSVENALKSNPAASLVIITSPTYEGVASDIKSISEICRRYGARLFVDEAHGAHFPFSEFFPKSAIELGADASVISLHKTLPALTQTALLLTNLTELESKFQYYSAVFQTSSPSYVLMSSVDVCLDYVENNKAAFEKYVKLLKDFEQRSQGFRHIKLLFESGKENVFDYDCGKLVISTSGTNLSGTELADILRNKYQIEVEMAASDYIIAVTSVCDTKEGFNRLYDALTEIDSDCVFREKNKNFQPYHIPEKVIEPCECENYRQKLLDINLCEGKISLEDVFAYPPGVPLLVSGEAADKKVIELINSLKGQGINVISSQNNCPGKLLVADL